MTDHLDAEDMIFDQFRKSHQVVARHFRRHLPKGIEYYMHHFTIKYGSNYYGLIFGSGHSLGMEKFLRVCWKKDPVAGESSFNISDDTVGGLPLFEQQAKGNTIKILQTKGKLREQILKREIVDNIEGMKHSMRMGCLPKVFVDVIKEMKDNHEVIIVGKFNQQASDIHRATKYNIVLP